MYSNYIRVIVLGHRSQAGKDTAAGYLREYEYERKAFADKLKDTVSDLYCFTNEQMHGALKDVVDSRYPNMIDDDGGLFTPRRILQVFGQQQRAIYPDIWAQYVFNKIDDEVIKMISCGGTYIQKKYVITDFRFRNEAAVALRWADKAYDCDLPIQKQLFLVKIDRPGAVALSGSNDVSEHDLDSFMDWDCVLDNSGTLKEFESKVHWLHNKCERELV